jgi:hypothetical protein
MTRELIKMDQQGELTGGAAYIFRDQREVEELYDLDNDPDEVHNLANDPKYRNQLVKMRKMLANWQLEIGDKGFIDEYDLVQMFWPGLVQPSTERVQVKETSKGLVLSCPTEGASIGYQIDKQIGGERWLLYSKPVKLKKGQKILARALRIGYQVSQAVDYTKRN